MSISYLLSVWMISKSEECWRSVFPSVLSLRNLELEFWARKQSCFEFRGSSAEHRCQAYDKFQKVQLGISSPEVGESSCEWTNMTAKLLCATWGVALPWVLVVWSIWGDPPSPSLQCFSGHYCPLGYEGSTHLLFTWQALATTSRKLSENFIFQLVITVSYKPYLQNWSIVQKFLIWEVLIGRIAVLSPSDQSHQGGSCGGYFTCMPQIRLTAEADTTSTFPPSPSPQIFSNNPDLLQILSVEQETIAFSEFKS